MIWHNIKVVRDIVLLLMLVAPRLPAPPCHDRLLLHSSLRLLSCNRLSLPHCLLSCIRLLSCTSHLAGCCISVFLPALPPVKPLLFGWLLHCLPSAGTLASHWAIASCCGTASHQQAPPPLAKLLSLVAHPPLILPLSWIGAASPLLHFAPIPVNNRILCITKKL